MAEAVTKLPDAWLLEEAPMASAEEGVAAEAVTGHTVVETAMIEVEMIVD